MPYVLDIAARKFSSKLVSQAPSSSGFSKMAMHGEVFSSNSARPILETCWRGGCLRARTLERPKGVTCIKIQSSCLNFLHNCLRRSKHSEMYAPNDAPR